MRFRRPLIALTAAVVVTAGAAAIASPALAASSRRASATVSADVTLETGATTAVYYIKPISALHRAITSGNAGSGHLTSEPIAPGRYVLQVQDVLATTNGDWTSIRFRVRAGQQLDLGTLAPTEAPLTLTGTGPIGGDVTDDFTGWNASATTAQVDSSGHYALGGLVPGRYRITAQKAGYKDRSYRVVVQEPVADVTVGKKLQ